MQNLTADLSLIHQPLVAVVKVVTVSRHHPLSVNQGHKNSILNQWIKATKQHPESVNQCESRPQNESVWIKATKSVWISESVWISRESTVNQGHKMNQGHSDHINMIFVNQWISTVASYIICNFDNSALPQHQFRPSKEERMFVYVGTFRFSKNHNK